VGGMAGLDRLLSFMTVRRLQVLIDFYRDKIEGGARAVFGRVATHTGCQIDWLHGHTGCHQSDRVSPCFDCKITL
jgi:hypothetical protein